MEAVKTRAIRAITGIKDSNLVNILNEIKETLEVLTGRRDGLVPLRDHVTRMEFMSPGRGWASITGSTGYIMWATGNIRTVIYEGTGLYTLTFSEPYKSIDSYALYGSVLGQGYISGVTRSTDHVHVQTRTDGGTLTNFTSFSVTVEGILA